MKRLNSRKMKSFYYFIVGILIAAMIPAPAFASAPSDIDHHWAKKQIEDWVSKGYINGYEDGSFKPNSYISRAEFMALVNRAFEYSEKTAIDYNDVKSGTWIADAVSKAKAAGYISGYSDNTIRPKNFISRQEAASIIVKITGITSDADAVLTFQDAANIPAWSKGSIAAAVNADIMNGYPDGSFKATGLISRAEAVATINNALGVNLTYDKAGSYGPETGVQTVKGSVTVSVDQVILQNMKIEGKLILAKSIGEGEVTLKNVIVAGDTEILGGGENSIIAIDSSFGKVKVYKENGKIRIVVSGSTSIKEITANSGVKMEEKDLTGEGFKEVIIDAEENDTVILSGLFESAEIQAEGVNVNVPKGTTVNSLILNRQAKITGDGTVEKAVIGANGVIFSKAPGSMESEPGIKPPTILGSSLSGRSGGGNSGGGTPPTPQLPAPAAPTNPQINDFYNSFDWTFVTGFESASDYEYTTNGGVSWTTCSNKPQGGLEGNIPAANTKIRVKADPVQGRPAGLALQADNSFTVNADVQLSNVVLSGAPSGFSFQGGTYVYNNVTVPNDQTSITVTPTLEGGNISITYEIGGQSINSGQTSPSIELVAGTPRRIVLNVSKLGYNTKEYEIYVTRQALPTSFTVGPQVSDITLPSTISVNLTVDETATAYYAVVPGTMLGFPTSAPTAKQLKAIGTPGEMQPDHYGVVPVLAGGRTTLDGQQAEQILIPTNDKLKASQIYSVYIILETGGGTLSEIAKTDFNTLADNNQPVFNQIGNASCVWGIHARSLIINEKIIDYDDRYNLFIWTVKATEAPDDTPSAIDVKSNGVLYEEHYSGEEYHITYTGLDPATEYKVYMVAQDNSADEGLYAEVLVNTATTPMDEGGPDRAGIIDDDCYAFSNQGDILNKYLDIQMDELLYSEGNPEFSAAIAEKTYIFDGDNEKTLNERGDTVTVHGDTLTITFANPPTEDFHLRIEAGTLQDTNTSPYTNKYEIGIQVKVPAGPEFNTGYPVMNAAGTDSQSVAAEVSLNEDAAVFWVLLTDNAAAPQYESNIVDKAVSGGLQYGNLSIDNYDTGMINITGLNAGTNYDLWFTAIDANNNYMEKQKIDLTTAN